MSTLPMPSGQRSTLPVEQLTLGPFHKLFGRPHASPALVKSVKNRAGGGVVYCRPAPAAPGRFEILSNAALWLAAQQARIDTVSVVIVDNIDERTAAALVKADVSDAISKAAGVASELAQQGATRHGGQQKIASYRKVSRSTVCHQLRLVRLLRPEVQELARKEKIGPGHLRAIAGLPHDKQLSLAKEIVRRRNPVRVTAAAARALRASPSMSVAEAMIQDGRPVVRSQRAAPLSQSNTAPKNPDVVRLEQLVSERVGCRVEIDGTRLVIHFDGDLDVLDGILQILRVSV